MKYILILVFLLCGIILPQDKTLQQKTDDAFSEMEENVLPLRFHDALNAKPITGAKVTVKGAGEFITDEEGRILIPAQPDADSIRLVFTHDKYINTAMSIELLSGTLFLNHFSVSPKMPVGSVRIILDWGETPRDLDAHLVKENGYHISFRNLVVSQDGVARLDRDDLDGFGPETITISAVDKTKRYRYHVHNYSNRNGGAEPITRSRAAVRVYGDEKLLHNLQIPDAGSGNNWLVFEIIGGVVELKSEITVTP